jgi:hypothetical protein
LWDLSLARATIVGMASTPPRLSISFSICTGEARRQKQDGIGRRGGSGKKVESADDGVPQPGDDAS